MAFVLARSLKKRRDYCFNTNMRKNSTKNWQVLAARVLHRVALLKVLLCLTFIGFQLNSPARAESVAVATNTPSLSALDLQRMAIDHVSAELATSRPNDRIALKPGKTDSRLQFEACSTPLQFEQQSGNQRAGRLLVKVRCQADKPWAVYVPLEIELWKKVVVTKRALRRGQLITADDVVLRETQLQQLSNSYLTAVDQAIGKEPLQNINAETALSLNRLAQPKLVKRGEQVVIIAGTGSVNVRMTGTAMSDGRKNQQISVRNLRSDRIIKARVIDVGTVQVDS